MNGPVALNEPAPGCMPLDLKRGTWQRNKRNRQMTGVTPLSPQNAVAGKGLFELFFVSLVFFVFFLFHCVIWFYQYVWSALATVAPDTASSSNAIFRLVTFTTAAGASDAIDRLQDTDLMGRPVRVVWSYECVESLAHIRRLRVEPVNTVLSQLMLTISHRRYPRRADLPEGGPRGARLWWWRRIRWRGF